MSRTHFLLRTGIWLVFLITALVLPLAYLYRAPTPVGTGLLRVFGWGALVGVGLGAVVYVLYRPLTEHRTQGGKLKALFGSVAMGVFGGAGGAALLDQSRIVDVRAVELPIVKIEQLPDRRRDAFQVATLAPMNPTHEDRLSATEVNGKWVREGYCLVGVVEQGWLGGAWVRRYTARPCSNRRGASSSHVITADADFGLWQWYTPRAYRLASQGRALDEGLPPNLTCRTRQGSWLYRCVGRKPLAALGRSLLL